MTVRFLMISSILIFMFKINMAANLHLTADTLYPWKSKSGLLGYSNQDGQLKITPHFEEASLFTNQYAIVQKDGKKGIVDKSGVMILNCQYDEIQLAAVGDETLAVTRKKYNAWWRANHWKLFPGFSIMGGNRDKRLFDTAVPRMKWEVILLGTKESFISSDHGVNEYPYDTANIQHFGTKILINNQLYQIKDQQVKHLRGVIKGVLRDSMLLQDMGNTYKIADFNLKPQGSTVYTIPDHITIKVNDNVQELQTVRMLSGIQVKFNFMQDQHARIYLYPDLKKVFPNHISKYFDQQTDAVQIIKHAQIISSVPHTDYFIIYSIIDHKKDFYILHQNGTWESDKKQTKDFVISSNSGNLLYPSFYHLGIDKFLPSQFELKRLERTQASKDWYLVSGIPEPGVPVLYGIFDNAEKKWILPLEYSSLEEMKDDHSIWKFERKYENDYKKKKYGLIDIHTGKITVPPIYTTLNSNGKAGIYIGEKWESFYINAVTGKEFRE